MNDPGESLEELERILCDDGHCIGTINEKGVCNICGKPREKPRTRGRAQEETPPFSYSVFPYPEEHREDIFKIIAGIIFGLLFLGGVLFLGATFLRVGWKFLKWAWG